LIRISSYGGRAGLFDSLEFKVPESRRAPERRRSKDLFFVETV
jgi:hypothetical protein